MDPNPPILWRPPYIAYPPPFFQILSNTFPLSLLPPTPTPTAFFGWIGDHATFDVLVYLMTLWIEPWYQKELDVCFMQQGIKFTEVWHIMWFFAGTLIWYHTHKHMHTHRQTIHSRASWLTHPYWYIFTPPVMSSQQLSLLHWKDNSLISKN